MKSFHRIVCCALALLMVLSVASMSFADTLSYQLNEQRFFDQVDTAWDEIGNFEVEVGKDGLALDKLSFTKTVYDYIAKRSDVVSINWESDKEALFSFKLDNGCYCSYDYDVRFAKNVEYTPSEDAIELIEKAPGSADVLLLGPYYGSDSSFTDQYRIEAANIADFLGGNATIHSGSAANGNSCKTFADYGVIIFDSHGTTSGGNSYLCLTSNTGISSEDFSSGRAVNGGSFYGVGGQFFEYYNSDLPNSMFWMAICLGMATTTICDPLLNIGAGVVMGYTESVTFRYDYEMETTVFDCLTGTYDGTNGEYGVFYTAQEAMEIAKLDHGTPDPYSSNRAALVLAGDEDWMMVTPEYTPVESVLIDPDPVIVYEHNTARARARTTPVNANTYSIAWSTGDASIATVDDRGTVTGVAMGETTLTVVLTDLESGATFTDTANVQVLDFPSIGEAVGNTDVTFTNDATYPWVVDIGNANGNDGASIKSGNAGSSSTTSTISFTVNLSEGDSVSFDWMVSSENNYDWLNASVNGTSLGRISGTSAWATITYTAPSAGAYTFIWAFSKDSSVNSGDDCGRIDNLVINRTGEGMLGDVNNDGTITSSDALMTLRFATGIEAPTQEQFLAADINQDGDVTSADALIILRIVFSD